MLEKPSARRALVALLVGELRRADDVRRFAASFGAALEALAPRDCAMLLQLTTELTFRLEELECSRARTITTG